MSDRSTSRVLWRTRIATSSAFRRPREAFAPPIGNRALARAISQLPDAYPPVRGLMGDRALLASLLARAPVPRLQVARCKVTTPLGEFKIKNYDPHETEAGDVQKKCGVNIDNQVQVADVPAVEPDRLRAGHEGHQGRAALSVHQRAVACDPDVLVRRRLDRGSPEGQDAGLLRHGRRSHCVRQRTTGRGARTDDTTATPAEMHNKQWEPAAERPRTGDRLRGDHVRRRHRARHLHGRCLRGDGASTTSGTVVAKPVASAEMG